MSAITFGPFGFVLSSVAYLLTHADSLKLKVALDASGFSFDGNRLERLCKQLQSDSAEQKNRINTAGNALSDQSITTLSSDDERTLLLKMLIGLNLLAFWMALRGFFSIASLVGVISSLAASVIVLDIFNDMVIPDQSGYKLDKSKLELLCNLLSDKFSTDKNTGPDYDFVNIELENSMAENYFDLLPSFESNLQKNGLKQRKNSTVKPQRDN